MVREDHKFALNALKGEKAECQLVLNFAKSVHKKESTGSEDQQLACSSEETGSGDNTITIHFWECVYCTRLKAKVTKETTCCWM